jgi:hypothetical protein
MVRATAIAPEPIASSPPDSPLPGGERLAGRASVRDQCDSPPRQRSLLACLGLTKTANKAPGTELADPRLTCLTGPGIESHTESAI